MATTNPLVAMGHLGLASVGSGIGAMLKEHPVYLECFTRLHHELMEGDGPLPLHLRRYIAIMASCRHGCTYLVEEQKVLFLEAGGPEEWLEGLQFAPRKIRELHPANLILAHRPWLFDHVLVQKLLKSSWSASELTQAICILAQFHALCSFVLGVGIEDAAGSDGPPIHHPSLYMEGCSSGSPGSLELSEGGVDILVERMRSVREELCVTEECTRTSFEKLKKQAATIATPKVDCVEPEMERYAHLSPDPEYMYTDFSKRGEKAAAPTMKSQDCSWEEHGYSLVSELYSEVAELLDHKFKTAYNFTYYTCGHETHVDTFPFRRGVWNYLHCLYGIRHDDYDYSQINQLLERNLKLFLKTVACYPERLSCQDPNTALMKGFQKSEKIHVMILVLEARLQAELLHALRSLAHSFM